MENFSRGDSDLFSIEVDNDAKSSFYEMAKWTKFLAILGFIFLGIMVIAGMFVGATISKLSQYGSYGYSDNSSLSMFAKMGAMGTTLFYLLIAGICFYPVYGLLKYSGCMKTALRANDKGKFNEAIAYLKNVFKYHGILAIIVLSLYAIVFIFALAALMGR